MDTELFKSWLKDHLLKYAVGNRPLLLVLDGHSTHYQPELIKYAKSNDVVLICLSPHTTHESQPLDASMFKHDFSSEAFYQCYKEQQPEHQGAACSAEEFPAELEQSFQNILTTLNSYSG